VFQNQQTFRSAELGLLAYLKHLVQVMSPQSFFCLLPVIILVAGCYNKDVCCDHEPQGADDKLDEYNCTDIFLEINKTIESGNQFIDLQT
jgi:hypothetical protein